MHLSVEQQRLAAAHLPLAMAIASRFAKARPRLWDEYRSVALLALTRAAGKYEPARLGFVHWATYRIVGALKHVARQELPLGYRCRPKSAPRIHQLGDEPLDSLWDRSYDQVDVTAHARATA